METLQTNAASMCLYLQIQKKINKIQLYGYNVQLYNYPASIAVLTAS
jgi:hypothetical protein